MEGDARSRAEEKGEAEGEGMIEKLFSIGLSIALVSVMAFLFGACLMVVSMVLDWFLY